MHDIYIDAMKENLVEAAQLLFGSAERPSRIYRVDADEELARHSTSVFANVDWMEIGCKECNFDIESVLYLSFSAFRYFLPGIFIYTLNSGDYESDAFESIIAELSRSSEVEFWEESFTERWKAFSPKQIQWMSDCIIHMAIEGGMPPKFQSDANIALRTLEILKRG
ncbi:hypothetical protein TRP8649_00120 [Pelagimonas phthalicica]|uniref:Uncharacterized protein n=1 Tax=Pelagimonas phthalicica TaxID=1037362 RepID=A0A238J5X1_9RHOB|nr:hypothetical protein [Pelagimonas phthalicica]TDS95429.1 hypothetical protein CLV87_1953 [Pelagimonas phthalicica]SMX26048.1 hypothetical protein TRP8649_00120 [Pelagimonas phthalicica]